MYDPDEVAQAEALGPASEQYDDWLGTTALDDPHDDDALYHLAGLDPEEWTIVEVSMAGGRIGIGDVSSAASFYAVSRELVQSYEDFVGVASEYGGRLPVVQFSLDIEQSGLRLLEHVFKRWTIHAMRRGLARDGYSLAIIEQRDVE